MEETNPAEIMSDFEKTCLLYEDWNGEDAWEIVLATD